VLFAASCATVGQARVCVSWLKANGRRAAGIFPLTLPSPPARRRAGGRALQSTLLEAAWTMTGSCQLSSQLQRAQRAPSPHDPSAGRWGEGRVRGRTHLRAATTKRICARILVRKKIVRKSRVRPGLSPSPEPTLRLGTQTCRGERALQPNSSARSSEVRRSINAAGAA
jgi:hypothetical protein